MNEAPEHNSHYPVPTHRVFDHLGHWTRRLALAAVVTATALVILSSVLLSPLLLRRVSDFKGIDWVTLGNIGQTYGAVSAILSAVALVGIALSFGLQVRQARTERIRIVRERQVELLRIVLDDPGVYAPVIGLGVSATSDEIRQFFFATMWVNYSRLGYETGILTERMLREEIFSPMFKGSAGRTWWDVTGRFWTTTTRLNRQGRRFAHIASSEFQKAILEVSEPIRPPSERNPKSGGRKAKHKWHWSMLASIAMGGAIGILIGKRKYIHRQ